MTEIKAIKGRTKRWGFNATVDGDPLDLTGQTLYFTVKREYSDADADAIVQLSSGSGISVTNAAGGVGEVKLDEDDLSDMPDYEANAVWELVVVDAQENSYQIDGGNLVVSPAVLRVTP